MTKGVNAVNIQGESFNEELLSEAIEYIEDLQIFGAVSKIRKDPNSPKELLDDILQGITILLEDNIKLRLLSEEDKSIDLSEDLKDIRKRRLEITNRLKELNIIFERRK